MLITCAWWITVHLFWHKAGGQRELEGILKDLNSFNASGGSASRTKKTITEEINSLFTFWIAGEMCEPGPVGKQVFLSDVHFLQG